jgi:hypothetical protein
MHLSNDFPWGAGYTSDFVCDFMRDLLHIADACDSVHLWFGVRQESLSIFFCTIPCPFCSCAEIVHAPNRMQQIAQQIAREIACYMLLVAIPCRTPNHRCTELHLRYAANRTWNRTRNCSCNQPLSYQLVRRNDKLLWIRSVYFWKMAFASSDIGYSCNRWTFILISTSD